jgi:hypothetical protein
VKHAIAPEDHDQDRAFEALAAMLEDAAARLPTLAALEERPFTVSLRDWQHGEARCPSCGLHLDPVKDLRDKIYSGTEMTWTGVMVDHKRCGFTNVLGFS